MDALKQVTVSIAEPLLRGGQTAINNAINGAKQPWYKPDLPGDNSRAIVKGKLDWHASTLAPLASTPNAMYASGEDLKQWVLAAFREANAVEEGSAQLQKAWDQMWSDIADAAKALPKEVAKFVGDVSSNVVKGLTGLPIWAWALIATGVVGALGFFIWALARTPAGTAVAKRFPL
jgi:nitrate reductase NapE component